MMIFILVVLLIATIFTGFFCIISWIDNADAGERVYLSIATAAFGTASGFAIALL